MNDRQMLKNKKKMLPGGGVSWHKFKLPTSRILQTFKSPLNVNSVVQMSTKEMTALCPLTGFPDQYEVQVDYKPGNRCVESKSAKFYFGAYRNYKGFIETIAHKICDDFYLALLPKAIKVTITMNARGGIAITAKTAIGVI